MGDVTPMLVNNMPRLLTDAELSEIQARVDAATPGPWTYRDWSCRPGTDHQVQDDAGRQVCDVYMRAVPAYADDCNGAFIATARADVPRLLGHVRALEGLLADAAQGEGYGLGVQACVDALEGRAATIDKLIGLAAQFERDQLRKVLIPLLRAKKSTS